MKKLLVALAVCIPMLGCTQSADQNNPVIATVDSTAITAKDVQEEMKGLPEMAKEFFKGPEGAARFVDELTKREMLYLEAKKRGIDKDKDVEKRIEDFKKMTMIQKMVEKEIEEKTKQQPSEQEMKEFYEKNKDEFVENAQIRLSQIVVKSQDEAKKVFQRLQNGEDFKDVAGGKGGDMGFFKRGDLSPQLENVAFRLKKGQVSQPIPMKDGYHILMVTDVKGTPVDFEKAKAIIAQRLMMDRQKMVFDQFIENLKKNYKVEIKKEELAKLFGTPAVPQQKQAPAPSSEKADQSPQTKEKQAETPKK
jgi:peptidyl-prolyl cis-trans isomerase C